MTPHRHLGPKSFYKTALSIAVPVMLQGLIQNLVSLIDNFMVAGLGDMKMSGVNVTNQLIFVLFVALMTLMGAGGMFMSQFNGAKDTEGMRQTFRFKFHTSSILALLAVALTVFLPRQILSVLLNTNTEREAIVEQGAAYLSVIVLTFFPIAWSMAIGSSLREIGRVRAPLVISVAATLVNTFFNWVLIYGNLGAPRLEVRGAAIATLIARLVEPTSSSSSSRGYTSPPASSSAARSEGTSSTSRSARPAGSGTARSSRGSRSPSCRPCPSRSSRSCTETSRTARGS